MGVSNPLASFVMLMFCHQTRIVLKTLSFKLQPLILNRCLPNTFRSDQFRQSIDSHRGQFGVLSPHISFFILLFFFGTQIVPLKLPFKLALRFKILHLIEMTGAKYLSIPPHFCEKAPFPTLLMVLWKTYTLI